jgi:hypothetical protein
MSNTILEEMIASMPLNITNANNSIKIRNKSTRKGEKDETKMLLERSLWDWDVKLDILVDS